MNKSMLDLRIGWDKYRYVVRACGADVFFVFLISSVFCFEDTRSWKLAGVHELDDFDEA